jgi:hypothetical protein
MDTFCRDVKSVSVSYAIESVYSVEWLPGKRCRRYKRDNASHPCRALSGSENSPNCECLKADYQFD